MIFIHSFLILSAYLICNFLFPDLQMLWLSGFLGLALPSCLFIYLRHKNFQLLFQKAFKFRTAIFVILLSLGMSVFIHGVGALFLKYFDINETYQSLMHSIFPKNASVFIVLLSFLKFAIAPALSEELFFRGFFLNYDKNKISLYLIISSFLFASLHWNLAFSLSYLIMGFYLGILFLKTKNIIYPILGHATNNSLALIVLLFMES